MLICNLSEGVVSLCPTVPIHKETLHLQYYNSTTIILMNITYTYVCIFRMFNINKYSIPTAPINKRDTVFTTYKTDACVTFDEHKRTIMSPKN